MFCYDSVMTESSSAKFFHSKTGSCELIIHSDSEMVITVILL